MWYGKGQQAQEFCSEIVHLDQAMGMKK